MPRRGWHWENFYIFILHPKREKPKNSMKVPKKIFLLSLIVFISFVVAVAVCASYILFTASGGRFIILRFLDSYHAPFDAYVERMDGSLAQQIVLHNIELKNIKYWPDDVVVRIQKADIYFTSFDPKSLNIEVHSARLFSPSFGTVVIDAIYQDSRLEADIFSACLETGEIGRLFSQLAFLKNSSGVVSSLDVIVKGALRSLESSGTLRIDAFAKDAFSLKDISVNFNLKMQDVMRSLRLTGDVSIEKGTVILPRATFYLQSGKISFAGDPANPFLELRGVASLEGAEVKAVLMGYMAKPDLRLTSDPPMPQEKLLMMLLTGIGDISFKYDEQAKVFSLKKEVIGNVGVSYGVEQEQTQGAGLAATQKFGMSCRVADNIFVEGEKELQPESAPGNQTQARLSYDTIFLKYKKKF
jgi:hypothetical protein